jgi:hypothetical protein
MFEDAEERGTTSLEIGLPLGVPIESLNLSHRDALAVAAAAAGTAGMGDEEV